MLNGPDIGHVGYSEVKAPDDFPANEDEVKELIMNGKIPSVKLSAGGPSQTDGFYMIHAYPEYLKAGEEEDEFNILEGTPWGEKEQQEVKGRTVAPGLYYGHPGVLMKIVEEKKLDEDKFRFFIGISAWSAGQLESEIEAGAWTVHDFDPALFFNPDKVNKLVREKSRSHFLPTVN